MQLENVFKLPFLSEDPAADFLFKQASIGNLVCTHMAPNDKMLARPCPQCGVTLGFAEDADKISAADFLLFSPRTRITNREAPESSESRIDLSSAMAEEFQRMEEAIRRTKVKRQWDCLFSLVGGSQHHGGVQAPSLEKPYVKHAVSLTEDERFSKFQPAPLAPTIFPTASDSLLGWPGESEIAMINEATGLEFAQSNISDQPPEQLPGAATNGGMEFRVYLAPFGSGEPFIDVRVSPLMQMSALVELCLSEARRLNLLPDTRSAYVLRLTESDREPVPDTALPALDPTKVVADFLGADFCLCRRDSDAQF